MTKKEAKQLKSGSLFSWEDNDKRQNFCLVIETFETIGSRFDYIRYYCPKRNMLFTVDRFALHRNYYSLVFK